MGYIVFGPIESEEDLRRCYSLTVEFLPDAPIPNFQEPTSFTRVGRDGETNEVHALVHAVSVPEMRILLGNSAHAYSAWATTGLYNILEEHLRTLGHSHYFVNIAEHQEKIIKEYEKLGAVRVDPLADRTKIVRLIKKLKRFP